MIGAVWFGLVILLVLGSIPNGAGTILLNGVASSFVFLAGESTLQSNAEKA